MHTYLRLVIAFVLALPMVALAQGSPAAEATGTIGGKALSIRYAAPSVRGRQIFGDGGLLSKDPTYPAWRAGANAATTLRTDGTLDIGGLTVPPGTYTLYVWIQDPANWHLIVNKQTGQWGLSYTAAQDLGRVKMTMAKPAAPIETLKYTISEQAPGRGTIRLEWENHIATVPVTAK